MRFYAIRWLHQGPWDVPGRASLIAGDAKAAGALGSCRGSCRSLDRGHQGGLGGGDACPLGGAQRPDG